MKVSRITVLLLLFVFFGSVSAEAVSASSSAPRADVLLGCYAQDANGPITMRVNKEEEHYSLVAVRKNGSAERALALFSREPKASQAQEAAQIDALISDKFGVIAIVKSKKGVPINTTSPGSDIYFYAPQVGGPLFKRSCPQLGDQSQTSRSSGPRAAAT